MNSDGHGITVCKQCRGIISQCRCIDHATTVKESLCEPCKKLLTEKNKAMKILIACPTFGVDPNPHRWLNSLCTIIQDLKRVGVEFGFFFPYREKIHDAENKIIQKALTNKYTHILRMDDDVWGIQSGDVLKLIVADKDFISGVMFVRGFPFSRCAFRKVNPKLSLLECEKAGRFSLGEIDGDGVQPVDLTASPFTLFKTSIFDKMKYPWYDAALKGAPDGQFCQKCLNVGVQPHVHMDIQINHGEVTPWNRLFLFNSEARRALMTRQIDPTSDMYAGLVEMFGEDGCKDLYTLKGTGHEKTTGDMSDKK